MELPEGWEKAHKLAVYAMENGQKNVWFPVAELQELEKAKTPQFYTSIRRSSAEGRKVHLSGWTGEKRPVVALFGPGKENLT